MTATTTAMESATRMITNIHREVTYPHPRAKVWRALTDPKLIAKWLMRPENFAPVVGTKFKLVVDGRHPGWRGWVECQVLVADAPSVLSYTWVGDENHHLTCTFTLNDDGAGGTRLVLDHTGFEGFGGFVLAKLMMGPGWGKMMRKRLRAVIDGPA
jgi:uncharacterized protein YndB with AHSA1/START domain